jgi:hypothetical protein
VLGVVREEERVRTRYRKRRALCSMLTATQFYPSEISVTEHTTGNIRYRAVKKEPNAGSTAE